MEKYHFLCCENSVKLFCRRFRAACSVAAQNRSCALGSSFACCVAFFELREAWCVSNLVAREVSSRHTLAKNGSTLWNTSSYWAR